jgi:hypothetical protein
MSALKGRLTGTFDYGARPPNALNRYAEVVKWMAWPRPKNPRSSAQSGTSPQVTVTPASAAPAVGNGQQNTGISGASHTVADPSDAIPGTVMNGRGLRPIRFAHSGFQGAPGVGEDNAPGDFSEPPTQDLLIAGPEPEGGTAPANEGLSIFGGIPTTEVPDDDALALDEPAQQQPPGAVPATPIIPVTSGPSGATWNQSFSAPPRPVGATDDSPRSSFWMTVNGLLRGPAQAGDGQPRKTFRELPPDTQLRFWRYRVVIMVVVGLVFGLLTQWYIGLTLAILAGIIDTIIRSRNAPYYDNGATHPGAKRRTRRQLRRMRRSGYLTLDARPIPNSPEVIDHLVIGPTGVYAIDSEKWDRRLPVRTINNKRLYLGPASQKERLEHAVWEAGQASEILSTALGTKVDVRPALAIYGPKVPWDIATIRNVDVFTGTALRKYLKRRGKMREGTRRLTRQEVETYYATAARVLPDVSPARTVTPVG